MVRSLAETDKQLVLESPNAVVTEFREEGLNLCKQLSRPPLLPEKADMVWLWEDTEKPSLLGKLSMAELREYLVSMYPNLIYYYTCAQIYWATEFYLTIFTNWLPGRSIRGPDGTGRVDFIIFFSLMYPFPTLPSEIPFRDYIFLVKPLVKEKRNQEVVEHILDEDPKAVAKLRAQEVVDWHYTITMSYKQLTERVEKEIRRRERAISEEKRKLYNMEPRSEKAMRALYRANKASIEGLLAEGKSIEEVSTFVTTQLTT